MINDKSTLDKIENALNEIRPYLQDDGGDIKLVEVTEDWKVKVKLLGSCRTCDISMMTLKNGVEEVIKRAVPEVKEVVEVGGL